MYKDPSKRCLYVCVTYLNLVSSIVLQMTENAAYPADLILADASDFSAMTDKIQQTGLFDHVSFCPCNEKIEDAKKKAELSQKHAAMNELAQNYPLPHLENYTNLYVNLDTSIAKLFYYALLHHKVKPTVYLVEEATATYTTSLKQPKTDLFDHNSFGEDNFYLHIGGIYLYAPELYVGGNQEASLFPIQKIGDLLPQQKELLKNLFPPIPQIKERIIFFEGCFHGDGLLTDEYDLLMKIIDRVGVDNVIVKRHPRNKIDRYSDKGIKIFPDVNVPWEIMLLSLSLEGKLLISVASFTCLSPRTIYQLNYRAMLLNNLKRGSVYFLREPSYIKFISNIENELNSTRQYIWNPTSLTEMYRQLDYFISSWRE